MDSLLSQTLTYYGERTYTHLSERAYDIIVEMIITLQLTPGEIYSENAFIEMTGIGRTPIREAIKRLESINMLQSFVIPTVQLNSGDGDLGEIYSGISFTGADLFVPQSMYAEAKALLEGENDCENI